MAVGMHVSRAVSMYVFLLLEDDFEIPAERIGDTAERFQARDSKPYITLNFRSGEEALLRVKKAYQTLEPTPFCGGNSMLRYPERALATSR
jgi:hypothetical protein